MIHHDHRKYLFVISLLLAAFFLTLRVGHAKTPETNLIGLKRLPLKLGAWTGDEVEMTEDTYRSLGTRDVVVRNYKDGSGVAINLAIIYSSGSNRIGIHPPENCLTGGGNYINDKSLESVTLKNGSSLMTNKLYMSFNDNALRAWYWFASNDKFVASFFQHQMSMILDTLRGKNVQGAMIRIAATGDPDSLDERSRSFIREAVPHLRKILFSEGSSGSPNK
ncbi:MAG: exosortase C-terminal domain/associated protein EpsI [Candidatus Omnitrophota bacterium]